MAKVVGESGAWGEIAADIRKCGYAVDQPNDIEPLLARLRETYQPSIDRKKAEVAQSVASKENQIVSLNAEKGFWRTIVNWFRVRECNNEIARLHSEERQFIAKLDGVIKKLDLLRGSRELRGAIAELDVITHLARLPASFTVFNDIRLTADRYIHFNQAPLQSAQIDHLVLTPSGVFVIETKRWSKRFVESGDYHDPFDQIQRAAYLCFDQLRNEFGKIPVRGVIACAGSLPSAPNDSHVKILPISELNGYITWFKQQDLTPDELAQVCRYFEGFVTRG